MSTDELATICHFANRAAAVTVSRPGADPPWLDELCYDADAAKT